jgi:uncharacterized membrane protein YvbJ
MNSSICPSCYKTNKEGSLYCGFCGFRLYQKPSTDYKIIDEKLNKSEDEESSKWTTFLVSDFIFIGLLIMVILILIIGAFNS